MRPLLALGTPLNIATYLRRTSLDANWSQRELCAAASLATTITPLVPLSNLCTIPGRIIDPRASESDDTSSSSSFSSSSSSSAIERLPVGTTSSGKSQCPNTAFTNVPLACPALGCVTIPAGLFTTNTLESSYTMSNSIQGSGIASLAVSGSNSPATTSPGSRATLTHRQRSPRRTRPVWTVPPPVNRARRAIQSARRRRRHRSRRRRSSTARDSSRDVPRRRARREDERSRAPTRA